MIVLYDNNGTPVIDDSGNFVLIDSKDQVKQIIYNVLTTMHGEDLLNPDYGLDIKTLKTIPNLTPTIARAIVIKALNPSIVVGIKEILSIETRIEDRTLYLSINLVSSDDETTTENVSLGV